MPTLRPGMPPFAPSPYPQGFSPNANGMVPIPAAGGTDASPVGQSPATPMGFSNPMMNGMPRPPPQGYHVRPAPGLGFPPPYGFDPHGAGLPRPPHMMGMPGGGMPAMENSNFVKPAVKTTTVYVGGIPDGITDSILTGLIQVRPVLTTRTSGGAANAFARQTCGPLHKLNRMTGAGNKQAGFGFAEFEDPEVVLRCLKCLHGTELPDITPRGRQQGLTKKLVVSRVNWFLPVGDADETVPHRSRRMKRHGRSWTSLSS